MDIEFSFTGSTGEVEIYCDNVYQSNFSTSSPSILTGVNEGDRITLVKLSGDYTKYLINGVLPFCVNMVDEGVCFFDVDPNTYKVEAVKADSTVTGIDANTMLVVGALAIGAFLLMRES